jgi:xanthine/CO dehydrogenase XdhC/CoxF family maturation factor
MLMRDDDDILAQAAEDWKSAGQGVALATVVETWGSAPRPVGSHLVIDEEGRFLGSVSGGCVEGAVVTEALDVIESGQPRMLEFGVADETAWRVGLSCGGRIRVYVERSTRHEGSHSLAELNAERAARRAGACSSPISQAATQRLVRREDCRRSAGDELEKRLRCRQERHGRERGPPTTSSPCRRRRARSSSSARCMSAQALAPMAQARNTT